MPELTAHQAAATAARARVNRIPLSTYRLQLGANLNLRQVRELLPYLEGLGIGEIYLSPLFRSRAESSHGYDVVDHGTIDPEIGDLAAFEQLASAARDAGMGIVLDVVPNHMGINDPGNLWWLDVLENGEGSYFADFFDIDWRPAASGLQDKVLLPFLGDPFGTVLENGELQVLYANDRLQLKYFDRRFPLAPTTWPDVLEIAASKRDDFDGNSAASRAAWLELQSIITQLRHLPPRLDRSAAAMEERYREQMIVRQRLAKLLADAPAVSAALDAAITEINGEKEQPRSFDALERLLEQQWYRLAYWRVAVDEINYRRFFDVNDLAAIRVENPRVFDAVHRLVARLVGAGWVTGLRIDHPDGLRDPRSYFKSLQDLYRSNQPEGDDADEIYVVAEKILSGEERLPTEWTVCGTTGYDLMNIIGRVQIHADGLAQLRQLYDEARGNTARPADVVYESRRTVLFTTMASELQMLAARLYRIAQSHRASRDFTRPMLQRVLREVIASMTVYRTYVRGDSWDVGDDDYRVVTAAVRMAKRRNPTLPTPVFDYLASVLLLEHPPTLSDEQAAERREFALKMQQVSGPVAAKGVEDTAFYRYYPLASVNEVGGDLDAKSLTVEEFHRLMRRRMEFWPHSMSATATHDTKRGEDVRARLHVLSEAASEWGGAFNRWRQMNEQLLREVDGDAVPDANEEYLLYQTLVGTWPVEPLRPSERDAYEKRIVQYMAKAIREAKVHTSWMNPSESYDEAVGAFIHDLFSDAGTAFMTDLDKFVRRIADAGFVNSLAQLVLKTALPGVPDFYQGTELWDFNLVDPDNRRPVDFDNRRQRLAKLQAAADADLERAARAVAGRWPDGDVKLWVTTRCLNARRQWADAFSFGDYIPLSIAGPDADHLIAFARHFKEKCVIAVVPRHVYVAASLRDADGTSKRSPATGPLQLFESASRRDAATADGTRLVLPDNSARSWRCQLSGRTFETTNAAAEPALAITELFEVFPVALLTCE
jgi:(1->4)-alpha-D-glucan 1-alpha-D-glucosylmutase